MHNNQLSCAALRFPHNHNSMRRKNVEKTESLHLKTGCAARHGFCVQLLINLSLRLQQPRANNHTDSLVLSKLTATNTTQQRHMQRRGNQL